MVSLRDIEVRPSDSRKCLDKYIQKLEEVHLPWYEATSGRQTIYWRACSLATILGAFGTSVVGALNAGGDKFKNYGPIIDVTLIVLPLISGLAATFLTQFRFREMEKLRELGRIEIQDLIDWAKGQLARNGQEDACFKVYEDLRKKVTDLETRQHLNQHEVLAAGDHPQRADGH